MSFLDELALAIQNAGSLAIPDFTLQTGGAFTDPGTGGTYSLYGSGGGSAFDALQTLPLSFYGPAEMNVASWLTDPRSGVPAYWTDNVTGQRLTAAQAFQLDPEGFLESAQSFTLGRTPQAAALGAATTITPAALEGMDHQNRLSTVKSALRAGAINRADAVALIAPVQAGAEGVVDTWMRELGLTDSALPLTSQVAAAAPSQEPGFGTKLWEQITKNPLQAIGAGIVGATGLAGLGMAITGMARTSDGGGTITLPTGRSVELSPQEVQLLDLAVAQATDQADIARKALPILSQTLDAQGQADLLSLFQAGTGTAAAQMGGQAAMTSAAGAATAGAPGIFGRDVANEAAFQDVQGRGIQNLSDLLQQDVPGPGETLSRDVGTAADERTLALLRGGVVDPAMASLYNLRDVSQGGVMDFLGGRSAVPAAYQGLDTTRGIAEDQVQAALRGDAPVNPQLARMIDENRRALEGRLQVELGPGYATSTPGMRALRDFEQWAREQVANDNRTQAAAASNIAMPRASFLEDTARSRAATASPFVTGVPELNSRLLNANLSTFSPIALGRLSFDEGQTQQRFGRAASVAGQTGRGSQTIGSIFGQGQVGAPTSGGSVATLLGERPGALATSLFSNLSQVAGQQQTAAQQAALQNQLLQYQQGRDLVIGGGNLFGLAASPFMDALSRSLFNLGGRA